MAAEVLNSLINERISAVVIIDWLTTNYTTYCPILSRCQKEDFVPYFLNFLREHTSRILQASSPLHKKALFPAVQNGSSDIISGIKTLEFGNNHHKAKPVDEHTSFKQDAMFSPPGKPLAQSSPVHSSESSHRRTFNLQDFIVNGGRSNRKKSPSRKRINPTRLSNVKGFGSTSQTEQSSVFCDQPMHLNNTKDFEEERTLLRRERARHHSERQELRVSPAKMISCVEPDPSLISCPDYLNILADIYSCLLDSNLVLNIMTELCFVMGLLAVHTPVSKVDNQYFSSAHDCVYFATSVLYRQRKLLELLDKVTLKMLADNKRISAFNPDLHSFIKALLTSDIWRVRKISTCSESAMNVSFQLDTDNRQNFPSDQAFHVFRKQRDGLYDLLRTWEANHHSPGWSFSVALGPKIRTLLGLHDEPANYVHFARLFRSQLLGTSKKSDSSSLMTDGEIDMLKEVDPVKLNQLHARLVTPIQSSVSSQKLTFPGHQEFYRDFIVYSQNPTFLQHLSDSLAAEISSLNDTSFTASELEDADTSVDDSTRSNYLTCVSALQLLAKFLGFVTFLPYQSKVKSLPDSTVATQCSIRCKLKPQLDIMTHLTNAVQQHKLVLTVPWIVEYLSFMDPVSIHLPYYRDVFSVLFKIYYDNRPTCRAMLLITLLLGRLFESYNFIGELFYSWISQCDPNLSDTGESSRGGLPLDFLDVVDEHCLYTCCSNMGELKLCLSLGLGPSGRVAKHITPVSASLNCSSLSSAARQLELQMEESFFHTQPTSMRKTVEFVAERVASCCVKHICNSLLPPVKQEGAASIAALVEKAIDGKDEKENNEELERVKESLNNDVMQIASKCCTVLKKCCDINDYCEKRSKQALPLLLADEVLSTVCDACVQIAARQSRERVNTWIQSHIKPGLFMKEFQVQIDQAIKKSNNYKGEKLSHMVPQGGRNVEHVDEAASPTQAIMQLRILEWKILDGKEDDINNQMVMTALQTLQETRESRIDLISSAERLLPTMVADVALLLVAHRPDLMGTRLIEEFEKILQKGEKHCLTNLICPRNVMLLSQSKLPPPAVWSCLAKLLVRLLTSGVLTPDVLEEQCVALLRTSWPQTVLNMFSMCMQEVVNSYHSAGEGKFTLLLEFLSDTCAEMDISDFSD